ncbi:Protein GVQW1, partial [Plecturocebus cupreus]
MSQPQAQAQAQSQPQPQLYPQVYVLGPGSSPRPRPSCNRNRNHDPTFTPNSMAQSSWDYSHAPPCPANFVFFIVTGFLHVGQADLELPIPGNPPTLASKSAGITDKVLLCDPGWSIVAQSCLHASWLTCAQDLPISASSVAGIIEMEFHHVAQAGLELLSSSHPPASQSDRITDMSHCATPRSNCLLTKILVLKRAEKRGFKELRLHELSKVLAFKELLVHCKDGVLLCRPGGSAVLQSRFTITSTSRFKQFSCLSFLSSWHNRHVHHHTQRLGFTLLFRLVSNSTSHDLPPASPASQNAGITGVSRSAWPLSQILKLKGETDAVRVKRIEAILCLCLPSSWDYRHVLLLPANFSILVEMGYCHISQAGLELLTSSDLLALAYQSARITVMSHCALPSLLFSKSHYLLQILLFRSLFADLFVLL